MLMKHSDNTRKQYDRIPQLSFTKVAYAQSLQGNEEEMEYSVSPPAGPKWLLYSKGKHVRPSMTMRWRLLHIADEWCQ